MIGSLQSLPFHSIPALAHSGLIPFQPWIILVYFLSLDHSGLIPYSSPGSFWSNSIPALDHSGLIPFQPWIILVWLPVRFLLRCHVVWHILGLDHLISLQSNSYVLPSCRFLRFHSRLVVALKVRLLSLPSSCWYL